MIKTARTLWRLAGNGGGLRLFWLLSAAVHAGVLGGLALLPPGGAPEPGNYPVRLVRPAPAEERTASTEAPPLPIPAPPAPPAPHETASPPVPEVSNETPPPKPEAPERTAPPRPAVKKESARRETASVRPAPSQPVPRKAKPAPLKAPAAPPQQEKAAPPRIKKERAREARAAHKPPADIPPAPPRASIPEAPRTSSLPAAPGEETLSPRLLRERLAQIVARIERSKRYPEAARRMGVEGTAIVAFRIRPDGRVSGLALRESSGHPTLDEATLEAVRKAQPLPYVRHALVLPVRYTLEEAER